MSITLKKFRLPFAVGLFILVLLAPVQLKVETKMLLFERFFPGGGWIEILLFVVYGGFVAYKMQDPKNVPLWRIRTWSVFTYFFFAQLILGIFVSDSFLLTGKLHLPIPMMMVGGPIYRGQLSIMTLLFLSTIILTGPAWCSHLCYFGAMDGLASRAKGKAKPIKPLMGLKHSILVIVIGTALAFRFVGVSNLIATSVALAFGIGGIVVMFVFSRKKKQMVHCLHYCPVGTIVNYTKHINPFRMRIDSNCSMCMKCTTTCRYNALKPTDIERKKPGLSCTLCGDCVQSCHSQSINYKLFNLSPQNARMVYLFLSISLHAVFMAMGRI